MLSSDICSTRAIDNHHWRVTVNLAFYIGSRAVM